MKDFIFIFIIIACFSYLIQNHASQDPPHFITPPPTLTEDQCWERAGDWIFEEGMDQYGTDISEWKCILP